MIEIMDEKEQAKANAYLKKAAPKGETNDCTVRSFAKAFDIPYYKAHKLCAKNGRKSRSGFDPFRVLKGKKVKTIMGCRVSRRKCPHKTVRNFIKSHPTGTYIIIVYAHACTLKDGVMYDLHEHSFGQRVQYYMYVSKKDKIKSEEMKAA